MRGLFVLFLLLTSITGSVVNAQTDLSVILWAQGDLWRWSPDSPELIRLTQDGTLSAPAQSPDGTRFAYRSLAQASRDGLNDLSITGQIAEFDLLTDLLILDVPSGTAQPLLQQPASAALTPGSGWVTSNPVWSAAGDAVAWVQLPFQGADGQLIIQPLDGMSAQPLITLPLVEVGRAPELRWQSEYIAVRLTSDVSGEQRIQIISVDGAALNTLVFTPNADTYLQTWDWVATDSASLLGVLLSDGQWLMFDPLSEAPVSVEAAPVLYSPSAADGPLIRFSTTPDLGLFWEADFPQPPPIPAAYPGAPGSVALAPQGDLLVFSGYPEFGAAALWSQGTIQPIEGTGFSLTDGLAVSGVWWAPMRWSTAGIIR